MIVGAAVVVDGGGGSAAFFGDFRHACRVVNITLLFTLFMPQPNH